MNGIIVDGYSSGSQLARELREAGCTLHHVQSSPYVPVPYRPTYDRSLYATHAVLELETPIPALFLAGIPIDFVAAGSEPGVPVADRLGAHFCVSGNAPNTSQWRRNKALMTKRVGDSGLQTVRERLVELGSDVPAVPIDWFPVVVKPVDSAGSEDVQICKDQSDTEAAVAHILGRRNVFGIPNAGALIQEKLQGTQFMINAVSKGGHHKIIEIWEEMRLHTSEGHSVFDREVMKPSSFLHSIEIERYVKQVLTALGVEFGPSHTELFLTARGPILLESASRIQGGIDGKAVHEALGYSHISCTRDLLLDPTMFESTIREGYSPRAHVMLVNFISRSAGIIKAVNLDKTVESLPSFHSTKGVPVPGARIEKTIDLVTKPGHVYLVHQDPGQLEIDYKAIRAFEDAGAIFEVMEEGVSPEWR